MPIKCLLRDGLLAPPDSLFDYGCGHGDDLRSLQALGYACDGWDPVHRPNSPRRPADVVNLGFVLNVIKAPDERLETLRDAWSICHKLLVVAGRVAGGDWLATGGQYGDGVVTRLGTFQKLYGQSELREYIQAVLETEALPAANRPAVRPSSCRNTYSPARSKQPTAYRRYSVAGRRTRTGSLRNIARVTVGLCHSPAIEYNMVRICLRLAAQPANPKTCRWPFCECTAMDSLTIAYYASNTGDCVSRYEKANVPSLHEILRPFGRTAPRILEIGGGSGRDAAFLVQLGCETTYTDGCEEMVAQAQYLHPELAGRARCAAFPLCDDDDLFRERFDLVLCAAVIMHLDDPNFERLASQVARLLVDDGHLVLSHSRGHQCARGSRDAGGRLFLERTPAIVGRIFEAVGFRLVRLIENSDGLGRDGITWATHVLQKTS